MVEFNFQKIIFLSFITKINTTTYYRFTSLSLNNNNLNLINNKILNKKQIIEINGDWGLGIGDWGLGIGD